MTFPLPTADGHPFIQFAHILGISSSQKLSALSANVVANGRYYAYRDSAASISGLNVQAIHFAAIFRPQHIEDSTPCAKTNWLSTFFGNQYMRCGESSEVCSFDHVERPETT